MKLVMSVVLLFLMFSVNAKVKVGAEPPAYLGEDRQGQDVLLSEKKGKVIVATFWASWCPPCLKELNVLDGIQQEVDKENLEVIAINFKEDNSRYRKIKREFSSYIITMTRDRNGYIGRKFGVEGVPHLLLINKEGKIHKIYRGYGEGMLPKLIDDLNSLLASK